MKDKKTTFTLNRETLMQIDDASLGVVQGGATPGVVAVTAASMRFCGKAVAAGAAVVKFAQNGGLNRLGDKAKRGARKLRRKR